MQLVETRCISPTSLLRMPSYSVKNPYAKILATISTRLPDITYTSKYIIKIKIHSSCEIDYFVKTHLCKLCVILRSRVLRVVYNIYIHRIVRYIEKHRYRYTALCSRNCWLAASIVAGWLLCVVGWVASSAWLLLSSNNC